MAAFDNSIKFFTDKDAKSMIRGNVVNQLNRGTGLKKVEALRTKNDADSSKNSKWHDWGTKQYEKSVCHTSSLASNSEMFGYHTWKGAVRTVQRMRPEHKRGRSTQILDVSWKMARSIYCRTKYLGLPHESPGETVPHPSHSPLPSRLSD